MGLWFVSPSPVQDTAEPHPGVLQGEASQEIRWQREGWPLPGGGAEAGKMGGGTERGRGRNEATVACKLWGEAQARGSPRRGWGCLSFRAPTEAGCCGLCGFVPHPLPPSLPPSLPRFRLPRLPPVLFSCPVQVSAVSRQHWHEGRWPEGRPGLWRAWNLQRGQRGLAGG